MNQQFGSKVDDLLEEEGLLAEVEMMAIRRVVAFQVAKLMEQQQPTNTAMAERMHTSRASLNRLLNPSNPSLAPETLE